MNIHKKQGFTKQMNKKLIFLLLNIMKRKMEDKNQRDIKLNDFQKNALIIYFFLLRKEENRTKQFFLYTNKKTRKDLVSQFYSISYLCLFLVFFVVALNCG